VVGGAQPWDYCARDPVGIQGASRQASGGWILRLRCSIASKNILSDGDEEVGGGGGGGCAHEERTSRGTGEEGSALRRGMANREGHPVEEGAHTGGLIPVVGPEASFLQDIQ
jgi:hypothetical protein